MVHIPKDRVKNLKVYKKEQNLFRMYVFLSALTTMENMEETF